MSIVIKVENLSKQYRLGSVGKGSLEHDVLPLTILCECIIEKCTDKHNDILKLK